jgi:RNA-directed DNA polymerase
MMNKYGKSDSLIVPGNSPNNGSKEPTEVMEERGLAKVNSHKCTAPRTQGRTSVPNALERVRHAAKKDKKQKFTALLHHVYHVGRLREA